jgi:hypothetical protein
MYDLTLKAEVYDALVTDAIAMQQAAGLKPPIEGSQEAYLRHVPQVVPPDYDIPSW